MNKAKSVLWGLILIILGVLLGMRSLGMLHFNIFFDGWWTLFIIIPCVIGLVTERDKVGNLIGVIVGVVLLLAAQDWVSFAMVWQMLWPALLVIGGLYLILHETVNTKINSKIKELNESKSDLDEQIATFSGQKLNAGTGKFKGINLQAIFGGIDYDLREAKIEDDAIINCQAIFGGIDIKIPEDVQVEIKSTSIFGGVSDKTKTKKSKDAKKIYVNATCIFGGVDVK